jgi:hypothetical protein
MKFAKVNDHLIWGFHLDRECVVVNPLFNVLLISSGNMKFLHMKLENFEENVSEGARILNVKALPPVIRYSSDIAFKMEGVDKCLEELVRHYDIANSGTKNLMGNDPYSENEMSSENMLSFEIIAQMENGIGCFEAYKNKSIKVCFRDRTVVRIYNGDPLASVLTRLGESLKIPIEKALDFKR